MKGLRGPLTAIIVFASLCPCISAEAGGRGALAAQAGEFASRLPPGSDVLAEAARWLGSGKMTGLHGPWCADFVSFVLRRAGHAPLAGRMAADALRYGPRLAGPRPGALIVIRTQRGWAGHVGIVEGVEADGSIRIISGNWGRRVARGVVSRRTVAAIVEIR